MSFEEFKTESVDENTITPGQDAVDVNKMAETLKSLGFSISGSPTQLIEEYFEAMGDSFSSLPKSAQELLMGLDKKTAVIHVHESLRTTGVLADLQAQQGEE